MAFVIEGNWLGVDWNAVSAVATLVLLIGALVELQLARRESRIARKPLVSLQRALIDRDGRVRVWLQNQGTGPATDIKLQFWVAKADKYLRGSEVVEAGSAEWERRADTPPDVTGLLSAIGASQQEVMYYVGRFPEIAENGDGWGLLGYRADARDIHGAPTDVAPVRIRLARRLRLTPSRRVPGWTSIVPEWNAEFRGDPLEGRRPGTM
jgi:hypothetical protein